MKDDSDTVWIDAKQVAEILGVTPTRVRQLARRGFLPYERISPRKTRYRLHQIEVIANARDARWWQARSRAQEVHGQI